MATALTRRQFLLGRPARRGAAISQSCLEAQGIVCQACRDACPAGAVRFFPLPGGFARPRVDADRCTACGDCVAACPASAIAVKELP